MPRKSSIDRMPDPIRAEIGRLNGAGWTIDEILEYLRQASGPVAPSRSALGRHVKNLAKVGERLRQSRQVAEALVKELGHAPESQAARLNIEMMHTVVLDLFMKADAGEGLDAEGAAALAGNPEGVMMLAKALDHLARASKTNVDFLAAAEKRAADRARTEAATAAEKVAKERGISGDTLEAIKRGIFGVKEAA